MSIGGLFFHRNHNAGSIAFKAMRERKRQRTMAKFADALADGAPTVAEAAKQAGVSQQHGSQMLARMRRELGWQAQ